MENNILQKVREDISAYLDFYKLDKYYKLHGFDYANGEEFDRMILLTEEEARFIMDHLEENSLVFNINLCEDSIPFEDKINNLLNTTAEYPAVAWDIDLSVFTFPLTFTISEIENPNSLPKNTEQHITLTKEEIERLLLATAKFWLGGGRMSAYSEIYDCLSQYVRGVDSPYVIFCETINDLLASIIGPYKIEERIFSNAPVEYHDAYIFMNDGGVIYDIYLSLSGQKLKLLEQRLSNEGIKDRTISADFTEFMTKLGKYDRHEAFNTLKSRLIENESLAVETLTALLKTNNIRYQDALNTYQTSSY